MKRSTCGTCCADQRERPLAIGRQQAVQEQLFALQRAAHRPLDRPLQRLGQRDQQRVRKVDDVRQRLGADPVDQLVELLAQDTPTRPRSIEIVRSPSRLASVDSGAVGEAPR